VILPPSVFPALSITIVSGDRLVTLFCLIFMLGGMPVLLTSHGLSHFGPPSQPPNDVIVLTSGVTNLSLQKHSCQPLLLKTSSVGTTRRFTIAKH
jgi:hypothetical protein